MRRGEARVTGALKLGVQQPRCPAAPIPSRALHAGMWRVEEIEWRVHMEIEWKVHMEIEWRVHIEIEWRVHIEIEWRVHTPLTWKMASWKLSRGRQVAPAGQSCCQSSFRISSASDWSNCGIIARKIFP